MNGQNDLKSRYSVFINIQSLSGFTTARANTFVLVFIIFNADTAGRTNLWTGRKTDRQTEDKTEGQTVTYRRFD